MISRVAPHVPALLCSAAALCILPGTAFPQASSAPVQAEAERIAEDIRAAEAEGGTRSTALIVPLAELSLLYRTEGDHALAIATLEQARQVVRANFGVHSLDQVELLRQALENYQALGDIAMVQALEENLYELALRHPDDMRTVAIHRDIAMRRLDILRRVVADEYPREIYGDGLYSVNRGGVIATLLTEAQIHLLDAAAVVLRNGLYASDELRDLEMEVVRASNLSRERNRPSTHSVLFTWGWESDRISGLHPDRFGARPPSPVERELQSRTNTLWDLTVPEAAQAAKQRRERVDDMTTRYELGRESYRRLIAYAETESARSPADGGAWRTRLEAYLQLADWDLLHSENGVALGEYAQVHAMLETAGVAEPSIAEIFAPALPIVLPAFEPNPLDTVPSGRYIDVAFEITRYGESRHVEIRGASPNVSDAARKELELLIKNSRFRPRVTDGELARAAPVVIRYYLNDAALVIRKWPGAQHGT